MLDSLDHAVGIAMAGIGIPAVLGLCGSFSNGTLACASAALALWGLSQTVHSIVDDEETSQKAVLYAEVCSRMMALTALGEAAGILRRLCLRQVKSLPTMRLYECMALLMCGCLVLAQFVDVLQLIVPGTFESGTFLGIVVAGLSFSMRDILSCIVSGLFESIRPRFAVGDRLRAGGVEGKVSTKGLFAITLTMDDNTQATMPCSKLGSEVMVVDRAKKPVLNAARPAI